MPALYAMRDAGQQVDILDEQPVVWEELARVYEIVWRWVLLRRNYTGMGSPLPASLETVRIAYDSSGLRQAFTFYQFAGFAFAMDSAYLENRAQRNGKN